MPSNVKEYMSMKNLKNVLFFFLRLFNKEHTLKECIAQKRSIHTNWLKLYLDREEPKEGQIIVFQRSFQAHYF